MNNSKHYDLSIFIDEILPFIPFFVLFYILAYVQWGMNYVVHSRIGKEQFYHIVTADIIAKLLCMICFILLPTEITRPQVPEGGIWNFLTKLIYSLDTPRNLFPSIHCLESWIAFRAALMMKGAPRWYAPLQLFVSAMVFLSTVFIKQHFFVDIIAGILAVEIGWILSRRLGLWKILYKIELPFVRKSKNTLNVKEEKS
jgi:membrane-associated phospholipid phosphatase